MVITLTPKAFAIGIITEARPLAPAFIRSVSPPLILPSINKLRYAVANASGIAAASTIEQFLGTGISISYLTFAYSAYPPPPSNAHTLSPIFQLDFSFAPSAISTIVPAISSPIHSGQPAGGG